MKLIKFICNCSSRTVTMLLSYRNKNMNDQFDCHSHNCIRESLACKIPEFIKREALLLLFGVLCACAVQKYILK